MYSSILFLILTYQATSVLAMVYNDKCTKTCALPGLICVNNRCKCDSKNLLFWTGARCAPCPTDWSVTETQCIALYETSMTWDVAKATCAKVQADLISFRHRDIIPLIYNVTSKSPLAAMSNLRVWTSAYAVDLAGLGVYRWLDTTQKTFNSKNDWWCKPITDHTGYVYKYQEPTKFVYNGVTEECVAYWRGTTNIQIVCLDDQLCSQQFPFICEKSESTAQHYLGPAPISSNSLQTSLGTGMSIKNITNTTPKAKKKSKGMLIIIIIAAIALLILLCLICGLVYFLKRRNTNAPQKYAAKPKESIYSDQKTIQSGNVLSKTVVPENIAVKHQKNNRAGYSKQQFDEFD